LNYLSSVKNIKDRSECEEGAERYGQLRVLFLHQHESNPNDRTYERTGEDNERNRHPPKKGSHLLCEKLENLGDQKKAAATGDDAD
jgi:hypothetical protein